ncbi:hypothetical protein EYF80_067067 [Liparis tanakae]|uniref:Uncharacterized protein n=1 Tax=Liparis tanakae TaxID=230148 RepID=A0A4Z2E246_9TELE|nr:hypothetical protein EYF80_067067 [Liparis tanakae]
MMAGCQLVHRSPSQIAVISNQ